MYPPPQITRTLRRPSSILGNSDGFKGSRASFTTDLVICCSGRKMHACRTKKKSALLIV